MKWLFFFIHFAFGTQKSNGLLEFGPPESERFLMLNVYVFN
jgi:hypothetical protein